MRKKIALAGLGIGLAAAFLPVSSASAFCNDTYRSVTGDCSPCHTAQDVYPKLICAQ